MNLYNPPTAAKWFTLWSSLSSSSCPGKLVFGGHTTKVIFCSLPTTLRFTQKYLCRRVAMTTVTLIPVQLDSRPREGNLLMMLKEREKKCCHGNLPPPPLRRRSCTRSVMVSKRRDFLLMTLPVMLFLFRPKLLSNKSSRNAPSMMVSGCCVATSYTHTLITSYTHTLTYH